jgi:hypothetical protein
MRPTGKFLAEKRCPYEHASDQRQSDESCRYEIGEDLILSGEGDRDRGATTLVILRSNAACQPTGIEVAIHPESSKEARQGDDPERRAPSKKWAPIETPRHPDQLASSTTAGGGRTAARGFSM